MKYRHLPTVVEAVRWDGNLTTYEHIAAWAGAERVVFNTISGHITIKPSGLVVTFHDWIILTPAGELYPCSAEVFAASYEGLPDD